MSSYAPPQSQTVKPTDYQNYQAMNHHHHHHQFEASGGISAPLSYPMPTVAYSSGIPPPTSSSASSSSNASSSSSQYVKNSAENGQMSYDEFVARNNEMIKKEESLKSDNHHHHQHQHHHPHHQMLHQQVANPYIDDKQHKKNAVNVKSGGSSSMHQSSNQSIENFKGIFNSY